MKQGILAIAALGIAALAVSEARAAEVNLRAIGIVSTHKHHTELERSFYETLGERTGLDIAVNFNPLDVVGVKMQDTFRMVRSGTFDIVETTIGAAAQDDPFAEGLDLIGVSPDIETLESTVDAYREVFAERMASRFNAKVLTLWPYGPQVFYCSGEVNSLSDLSGKKVRSYTPTMSALVESLGATPVTLQFPEVYPALQRGVADCAITSPTSGNTGNWPEVTDRLISLGISWSVQGHFMNLDSWNRLTAEQQEALEAAFQGLEDEYWAMARELTGIAINCNVGAEPCRDYNKFDMALVEPSEADKALVKAAVTEVILPTWADTCSANYDECIEKWNSTIGAARGLSIAE